MKHISNMETGSLCRSLSELIHAGISAGDGLTLLAAEEIESGQKELLLQLAEKADCGFSLSEAFRSSGAFAGYVCALTAAGEKTGKLEAALRSIADGCEERQRTEEQMKSALLYPAVLFLVMTAVIAVLLTQVLPVFDSVYAQLGGQLTGLAGWLLTLGSGLNRMMPLLCVLFASAGLLLLLVASSSRFRAKSLQLWCRHQGERGICGQFYRARTAQVLAMGMESGLPMEETLRMASELLDGIPQAVERLHRCGEKLGEGMKLGEAFRSCGILPGAECRLLETGILAGRGDRVMNGIAERMQEQAEAALHRRISQAEPVMVLAASAMIGVILLSVMLPMIDIMAVLG